MQKCLVYKKGISLLLVMVFLIAGCTHATLINSNPSGASIVIDGNDLGLAPVTFNDTSGVPKTFILKVKKPGYKEINVPIKQAYRGDVSLMWLLAAIIPYFFTATLNDAYNFNLEKN